MLGKPVVETLNRSFTIILAVHQPYSIMLHVRLFERDTILVHDWLVTVAKHPLHSGD